MFRYWLKRFKFLRTAANRPQTSRLRVEVLEDRITPATVTVTDTGDTIAVDGKVTLREAIESANNNANVNADVVAVGAYGNDTINFAIGAGQKVINVGNNPQPLTVTDPVTINGYSQPGS